MDLGVFTEILTAMKQHLADAGGAAEPSAARAKILACLIGNGFNFAGDRDTYDDPDNADMVPVIDRRRRLSGSLSILYVAAARRVGWAADALNTPGHTLVRVGADTAVVLVDPFAGGGVVRPDHMMALTGGALPDSEIWARGRCWAGRPSGR
ncbi:transglutaminase family protein [Sphingomonas profundi]|uniref:transglutaminase family protein n=1 Tax=Alterirhizorhabdus profundi TaxID=2681549 RepID=UPI0018D16A9E